MARDDPPASSTASGRAASSTASSRASSSTACGRAACSMAAAMRGKVGSEFET